MLWPTNDKWLKFYSIFSKSTNKTLKSVVLNTREVRHHNIIMHIIWKELFSLRFAQDTCNSVIKLLVFIKINCKWELDNGKGNLNVKITIEYTTLADTNTFNKIFNVF